ncbi:MAG TPA: aminotransferase class III-fold pyridoxal phosphate-dependent enzyme [Candidatus Binatia bacterium]|nr:aminotransferase class III-fold pyridoxal phosphate-dependent enzyme [Candidatus Binatia bacterium]
MSTRFWHGFADMHVVRDAELVLRAGDGVWVEDVEGRRYLDATAALWYCNVGFGRAAIAEAVRDQLLRLAAYSCFGPYATEPTVRLAERLADLAPIPDAVVFFASGGSDAVDSAAKLVRRYWDVVGRPEKRIIVSREHGYHGMHAWGTSLGGIPANKAGYGGEIIEEVIHVGAADTETLGALFERRASEIAAFIGEPVIGAGGVIPPEPGYWAEVARLCREHDVLLIADEVITGFGRLGRWWGSERYGIEPDVVTFAKGVTSGYVPLGGLLVGRRVAAPFWTDPVPGAVWRHGYTYSGHATACAAALANLDLLEAEGLVDRVRGLEPHLAEAVGTLAGAPLVGEVRAVGLMAAVELERSILAADPGAIERVVVAMRKRGVLSRSIGGRAVQISPAFVIEPAEIDRIVEVVGEALTEVAAG